MTNFSDMQNEFLEKISGTHVEYYHFCKRQLWFFHHQIVCEQESDLVKLGKVIHENSYEREQKEIRIGNNIVLDFADVKAKVIHEVKKSDRMEKAHLWQLKFYLWVLKSKGIEGFSGQLDYPKLKKTVAVELTDADCDELAEITARIEQLVNAPVPPARKTKACLKCAYYELCYV